MLPLARLAGALVAATPILAAGSAGAWTDSTQERIAENAARLMPPALQTVLSLHEDRLLEGARAAARLHQADHYQNLDTGTGNLAAAIDSQSTRVLRMLNARAPLRDVVYEMGVLSHLVADAQNPLNTSSREIREAEYAEDFERYVERKLDRFPLVFYGYRHPALDRDDYRGFALSALERSSRYYDWLVQDYLREGKLQDSDTFSDFSFAFGAGALSISHAVCDTASIWLHLWKASHGDTSNLPMTKAPVRIPRR